MQHREHDLSCALAFVRSRRIRIDRNAASVVIDTTPTIGHQRHPDTRAIAGHCFIDGVVDHFPNEVMQAGQTSGADVHAGPLAHRIESFEDLNVFCTVIGTGLVGRLTSTGGVSQ